MAAKKTISGSRALATDEVQNDPELAFEEERRSFVERTKAILTRQNATRLAVEQHLRRLEKGLAVQSLEDNLYSNNVSRNTTNLNVDNYIRRIRRALSERSLDESAIDTVMSVIEDNRHVLAELATDFEPAQAAHPPLAGRAHGETEPAATALPLRAPTLFVAPARGSLKGTAEERLEAREAIAREFVRRVWGPFIDNGTLHQNKLRELDPGLMKFLDNVFDGRPEEKAELVPTISRKIDARIRTLGADPKALSHAERIVARQAARAIDKLRK